MEKERYRQAAGILNNAEKWLFRTTAILHEKHSHLQAKPLRQLRLREIE